MNQKNTFSVESFLVSIIDTENKVEQLKELGIKLSLEEEIELRRFIHHNLRDVLDAHRKEIEDYGINIVDLEPQCQRQTIPCSILKENIKWNFRILKL